MNTYRIITHGSSLEDMLQLPGIETCEFKHGNSSYEVWVITCEEKYITFLTMKGFQVQQCFVEVDQL